MTERGGMADNFSSRQGCHSEPAPRFKTALKTQLCKSTSTVTFVAGVKCSSCKCAIM